MVLKTRAKQVSVCKDAKNEIHNLFDQLFANCYIDELTGRFHCKKCNNVVNMDLSRHYVFCPVHGMLI